MTRLQLLAVSMTFLWSAVAVRLVHLQWSQHEQLSAHAESQRAIDEVIPARRGDIVDRHGRLLATTAKSYSLFVDPSLIDDPKWIAGQLATPLGVDAERLADQILLNRHRKFLWVKRRLTEVEVEQVLDLPLPGSGWGLREEFRRVYPQGLLAAHVLGWRNIDGVPQAGVEKTLDKFLQGTDGRRTLVRDARGYVIEVLEEVTRAPQHGGTVTLTLDVAAQRIAEERLDRLMIEWKPVAVSAVVLDPSSGEILAMASRPAFDPNRPSDSPVRAWTNHALSSAVEPGSTIKPCLAAWAVDRELISREQTFECRGTYRMGRRVLHDHGSFGRLNVAEIITRSSNIGMAQIGEIMRNEQLFAAVDDFGFGRRTGVELPNESNGLVRPLSQWDAFSTGSIPMGQELAVTPLQMITAHAALANGGRLLTPHLVRQTEGEHRESKGILARQIIGPQTARWMTSGPMVEVIRRGTGRPAAIDGLEVFGKTGTAQKFDAESGGYAENRYVTSCLCGAPASHPRLLVLVTVDEPTSDKDPFGGSVAGPAASEILRQSLDLVDQSNPAVQRLVTRPSW